MGLTSLESQDVKCCKFKKTKAKVSQVQSRKGGIGIKCFCVTSEVTIRYQGCGTCPVENMQLHLTPMNGEEGACLVVVVAR